MKEKDITQKVLEDNNDIFADIVNVLLFDGDSEVEENELVNTTVHSQYKAEDGKVHEQERDIAKYWKRGGTDIVLYGIENQTKVEKRMPARISGYEGASYRGQCDKKTIVPVITMVLYYGTDRKWTAPKNLKSLIKVPDNLDKYVNDTKANVFEIAWLTDEQIAKFTSDFKIVADFFAEKRLGRYNPKEHPEAICHVEAVLNLLRVFTNDKTYVKIEKTVAERVKAGEVITMCTFAEEMTNKGIEIGEAQGIRIGEARGIAREKISVARNLLDLLTDDVIAEKVGLELATVKELREETK